MKAVILAGGKGTRAKPYTDYFPKAMMPVQGRPLIDYVVRYLSSFQFVEELIIVSDFEGLGGQIRHYFEGRKEQRGSKKEIKFVQDSGRGTAGDLLHVANLLKEGSEFILWFADNLGAIDLKKMLKFFKEKNSIACIATRQYRKEETGFVAVNDGIITEFVEKPEIRLQNHECTGIYILDTKILKEIRRRSRTKKDLNLSFDILQELSIKGGGVISAFDIEKRPWIDAESPAVLERNKTLVNQIIKQMEG